MDRGVDGRGAVDAYRVVIAVALREELEQMQYPALALVGHDILEDGGGSAVLGDDDRPAALGGPTDEFGAAAFERGEGLDVLGEIYGFDRCGYADLRARIWLTR
jgi:hypothetical protein